MPPKEEPKIASAASTTSASVSDSILAPQVEISPPNDTAVTAFLGEILREIRELKVNYSHLDSKIEAVTLERMLSPLQNPFLEQSPMHPSF